MTRINCLLCLIGGIVVSALPFQSGAAMQQASPVRGTVVTPQGRPLVSARVSFRPGPTSEGEQVTTTDGSGRFSFASVPAAGGTLDVAMIGFQPLRQTVRAGDLDVRLTLRPQAVRLDEMVVTGTPGETQMRAIGNAIGTLKPSEIQAAPRQVSDLLNGQIPGVAVSRSDGGVGGSALITIRGRSTFSLTGYPLIYVDGVRLNSDYTGLAPEQMSAYFSPLDLIKADDIASIEVVKGSAAATLYGTEAGAGVIQIITKKGRGLRKAEIGVSIRQGFTSPDRIDRFPTNWFKDPATGQILSQNLVADEEARGTPIFRRGYNQGYGINMAGSVNDLSYYTSLGYDNDEGITRDNWARRFTARGNLSFSPNPTLSVSTTFGLATSKTRQPNSNARGTWTGNIFNGSPQTITTLRRGYWVVPQEVGESLFYAYERNRRATGGVRLDHNPAKWFTQHLAVGLDLGNEELERTIPLVPPTWAPFLTAAQAGGSKSLVKNDLSSATFDYAATLTKPLTTSLGSKTSIGAQYYRKVNANSVLTGTGFPGPGLEAISSAATRTATEQSITNATLGAYAEQQFSMSDRVFLTGAIRVDNNSAFGKELDFVTYPKVSATWVINEEPWWKLGFVNALKLRGAWGASGNQPDAFAAIRSYQATAGEGDQGSLIPGSVGNPLLRPERTEEIEVGFDAGLLGQRLGIEFSYYHKKTKDAILGITVPPSSGFYPALQNINAGVLLNKGFEILANARLYEGRNIGVDLTVSAFRNTNKVLALVGDLDSLLVGWIPNRYQVGYPVASFFFQQLVSAERDASGALINMMCDGGTGPTGHDLGGTPVPCAGAPKLFIGKPAPDWEGSVTPTVTWRNLRLSAMVDFKKGESTYDWNEHNHCAARRLCEETVSPEKFSPETQADILLATTFNGSYYVRKLDFARLRDVSLNFTMPERLARSLFRAARASVTFAGRNLVTWTGYGGVDPESNYKGQFSNYDDGPWTAATTPMPRQFFVTINLSY